MAALCGAAGYFVYKTIQIYRRKSTFQDVFKVRVIDTGSTRHLDG
jgi:hypothetical protein